MSETTAFLAGTAVAGVSALLLLKGGLGVGDAMVPSYNPGLSTPPPLSAAPATVPTDGWSQGNNTEQMRLKLEQQNTLTAQLRSQLEQQETLTDDLQDQLERQRNEFDRVAARIEDQQRSVDRLTLQQGLPDSSGSGALTVPPQRNGTAIAIWVIGGIFVVVVAGGGALLLTVVLLSGQQQSRRQSRAQQQQHYILHSAPAMPQQPYAPPPYPPRYPSQPPYPRGTKPGQTYTLPPRNVRRMDNDHY